MAEGTLSFPLCLTVRGRMGKPPTAANPGKKMKHQRHSPPVRRLGGNMAGVQTLLGKEAASYVGHTASDPLTVTQHK